jgi:hypothetical protein
VSTSLAIAGTLLHAGAIESRIRKMGWKNEVIALSK